MRLPTRKPGKYSQPNIDHIITIKKLKELIDKLETTKKNRSYYMSEVSRLAEMGDFSENVEYQLAKGELRRINNKITILEHRINNAEIISPESNTDKISIGHKVKVKLSDDTEKYFTILGSSESRPSEGVISYTSPIGSALLGKCVGDEIEVPLPKSTIKMTVLKIS